MCTRMSVCLCHFSSHQKLLWLICLLAVGPGSLGTLPKELFGHFLKVAAPCKGTNCTYSTPLRKHVGMGFTECLKICIAFPRSCHHPHHQLLCHEQPAWACSVLLSHPLWYQLSDTRKKEMRNKKWNKGPLSCPCWSRWQQSCWLQQH